MVEKKRQYATIQLDKIIKSQIVAYCDKTGLKIGRFVENLFRDFVSGSKV